MIPGNHSGLVDLEFHSFTLKHESHGRLFKIQFSDFFPAKERQHKKPKRRGTPTEDIQKPDPPWWSSKGFCPFSSKNPRQFFFEDFPMPVGSKSAVEKIFSAAGTRKEELWLTRRRVNNLSSHYSMGMFFFPHVFL